MARRNWTDVSRKYLPIRSEAQLRAAAAEGVRRWQIVHKAMNTAHNQEERETADALFRQIIRDEDSGLIPFVPVELPLSVPLPAAPGDVVAMFVPRKR